VRALLDTNVFLWCIDGQRSRLSKTAARVIEDDETELLLSAVSLWEIALKARTGKLEIPQEKAFYLDQMNLLRIQVVLAVEARHIFELFGLPDHHRDPFDRLLVAQCMAEKLPFIASDAAMRRYPVQIIW
jgi:PIN domain nuclease of toxin-antitoxin system